MQTNFPSELCHSNIVNLNIADHLSQLLTTKLVNGPQQINQHSKIQLRLLILKTSKNFELVSKVQMGIYSRPS